MTRRIVVFEDLFGNRFVSQVFNGDKSEFEKRGSADKCLADWSVIRHCFDNVRTYKKFEKACSDAEHYYVSCLSDNGYIESPKQITRDADMSNWADEVIEIYADMTIDESGEEKRLSPIARYNKAHDKIDNVSVLMFKLPKMIADNERVHFESLCTDEWEAIVKTALDTLDGVLKQKALEEKDVEQLARHYESYVGCTIQYPQAYVKILSYNKKANSFAVVHAAESAVGSIGEREVDTNELPDSFFFDKQFKSNYKNAFYINKESVIEICCK